LWNSYVLTWFRLKNIPPRKTLQCDYIKGVIIMCFIFCYTSILLIVQKLACFVFCFLACDISWWPQEIFSTSSFSCFHQTCIILTFNIQFFHCFHVQWNFLHLNSLHFLFLFFLLFLRYVFFCFAMLWRFCSCFNKWSLPLTIKSM